ncbi:MAG: ECF transporter S component [Thermoprotei archaeon]
MTTRPPLRYTGVDLAFLGVVAIVAGIIFYSAWYVYDFGKAIGGIYASRVLAYGLWFIGAPLAATLIRKPGAAFLGEFLGALVETIVPTVGGFTNLIYGAAQGFASEIGYMILGYRRWGAGAAALAGALAAFPCIALDAVLFAEIYPAPVMLGLLVAAIISGAVYGAIAALVVKGITRR